MNNREKIISAIENAKKQSEEYAQDRIIVPFKETDMIIALLKEQEGVVPYIDIDEAKCPVCKVKLTRQELIGDDVLFEDFFDYCPHCGKPVLWEGR